MGGYSPPRPKWGAKRGVIKPSIYIVKNGQGHRPHDDDNNEEDNEVEDNDKDDDNDKDNNNDKGISVLGLHRELGFSRVPHTQSPFTSYSPFRDPLPLPQKVHCATTKIEISQPWD